MRVTREDINKFANGNYSALNKYKKNELANLYKNLGGNITLQKKPTRSGNSMMNKLRANAVYYGPGNRLYNKNDILEDLSMILNPNFKMNNALKYFPIPKNKYR